MSRNNYPEVGEEVMVKMKVVGIKERGKGGVYIDLEIPDWFNPKLTNPVHVTSEQGLVYRIKNEEN